MTWTAKSDMVIVHIYYQEYMCRETVSNRTSGKIKLTPPAYSHTTVLLVLSLNFGLLTQG